MPELQRQLEEIAYNGGLIKSHATALVRRLREFDCTVPESEQRCAMCLMGRIFSEVKTAAEHAESAINSIDKVISSKVKPDAPPKQMPAEPKKRTRASKIKIVEAPKEEKPKRARKPKEEKPAEPEKKVRKAKVSEDKPKEDVPKKRKPKEEKLAEPEKPKRKRVKKDNEDKTPK